MPRVERLRRLGSLLLCAALLIAAQPGGSLSAQTGVRAPDSLRTSAWSVTSSDGAVTVTWHPGRAAGRQDPWPLADIHGLQLPARLFAFAAVGPTAPRLRIDSLNSRPDSRRTAPPAPNPPAIPQPLGGPPRPDLAKSVQPTMPTTPVTLLR